jgi:hypothetical protein
LYPKHYSSLLIKGRLPEQVMKSCAIRAMTRRPLHDRLLLLMVVYTVAIGA